MVNILVKTKKINTNLYEVNGRIMGKIEKGRKSALLMRLFNSLKNNVLRFGGEKLQKKVTIFCKINLERKKKCLSLQSQNGSALRKCVWVQGERIESSLKIMIKTSSIE